MLKLASAAAAVLAVALAATAAVATEEDNNTDVTVDILPPLTTVFDLGVDVSDAGTTRADVARYLASLPGETRGVLVATCEHYMNDPSSVQDPQTLVFCGLAVN